MESFHDLGVADALVEALASEGLEAPTSLQAKALPVLRRGHDLVLRSGPGAGITLAYGVPVLEGIDPEGSSPQALILVPDELRAGGVAESLGRLAIPLSIRVSALAAGWADADRAHLVVATPEAVQGAKGSGALQLSATSAVVLDGLSLMLGGGMAPMLESILEALPSEAQRIAVSLPVNDQVQGFVDRHLKRATHVPPRLTEDGGGDIRRGTVEFSLVREDRIAETADHVARLLSSGSRHVLVFCRTEDRAADLGDLLDLRGFQSGYPGEEEATVWLGVDDMEGRRAIQASGDPQGVATISMDVPADPDAMDRRHGLGSSPLVLVLAREIPHLGEVAREAGYGLRSPLAGLHAPSGEAGSGPRLPLELFDVLREGSGASATPELAQLLGRYTAEGVAGAAVRLLLERGLAEPKVESGEEGSGMPEGVPVWVKIFLTVGERDGVTVGDLLGAVTGEAEIQGSDVGRIEIKDTYSRVEVGLDAAPKIVKALNGTSIRGRSVRADYDRGSPRSPTSRGGGQRGPRRKMKPRG
jgi:ATP-dependent RNA helicase DeaD